jgi:hypothetical protein
MVGFWNCEKFGGFFIELSIYILTYYKIILEMMKLYIWAFFFNYREISMIKKLFFINVRIVYNPMRYIIINNCQIFEKFHYQKYNHPISFNLLVSFHHLPQPQ